MKKSFTILAVVIVSVVLFWVILPTQDKLSEQLTSLDQYIPALMTEAAIPGLAIAKITNGKTSLIETYGMANLATAKPIDEDTQFNIASISKPIMGLALLKLVDAGKLDLDKNINDYLSFSVNNPNIKGEVITIRHLATHTSGIADFYDINSYAINQDSKTTLKQHLISLLTPTGNLYAQGSHYLTSQPGEVRKYSNLFDESWNGW